MQLLEEKFKNQSLEDLQDSFSLACNNGTLEEVKYLLSIPKIKENLDIADGLNSACYWNCLNVVKYIITSHDISDPKILKGAEDGFYSASENGHMDVVKYIGSIPNIKENLNLLIAFKLAGHKKQSDVLHYLIFDLKISKSKELNYYLSVQPNEQVENWFKLRAVHNKLNKTLPKDKIKVTNKNKI